MNMINENQYKWVWAAVFLIAAVLSFTLIHDVFMNWSFIKYAVTYLDSKADTVLGLTGASTSASVALTMIPGDVGTPIANQLASISSYSIIVLSAVHLEKYLITLAAVIALKILLPFSLVLAALNVVLFQSRSLTALIKKLCVFSAAVILVVPSSVYLSSLIETTYHDDVQLSIEETQKEAEEIKANIEDADQNIWDKFVSTVSGGTVELVGKFENSLNNFVEAISVMLITSCAIPLMTFVVLIWLLKALLQIDLRVPKLRDTAEKIKINPHQIAEKIHE
ncbi:MAG: hypothetical protein K6D03_08090 [Solobacterium sp.]|nr:hypothetical protein [Solobacterium sp.]